MITVCEYGLYSVVSHSHRILMLWSHCDRVFGGIPLLQANMVYTLVIFVVRYTLRCEEVDYISYQNTTHLYDSILQYSEIFHPYSTDGYVTDHLDATKS